MSVRTILVSRFLCHAAFACLLALGWTFPVLADNDVLSATDRTLYQQAFSAVDRGAWAEAQATASRAQDPILRDVLTWRRIQDQPTDLTFADVTTFIDTHPTWPLLTLLRQRAEYLVGDADPNSSVIGWFDSHPPITGRGKMALAKALSQSGISERAKVIAVSAWRGEVFSESDEKAFLATFGGVLTVSDHEARLDWLLWNEHTVSAKRMLPLVSANQRAVALARIAFIEDAKTKDALLKKVPPSLAGTPGLVYERVRWRRAKGLDEQAADLIRGNAASKGDLEKWWKERGALARHFLEEGQISRAYDLAKHHGAKDGTVFAEGEWLAGWIALRFLNDPKDALTHFKRMTAAVTSPISTARASYWAGRAAETLGQSDEAKQYYAVAGRETTTYYGQLAAEKAGIPPQVPEQPRPSEEERTAFEANDLIKAARALVAIGRADDIRPFLVHVCDSATTPGISALAATMARDLGRLDIAVVLSRRAAQKGTQLVETAYPIPDWSFPSAPEKALLLSIIRQESNFHTGAISRAGAKGLMQLMPRTARNVAKQEDLTHRDEDLTDNPDYNIRLGASYLQSLVDTFDGNYALAVAGYNAGPGRPSSWMRQFGDPRRGDLDAIDWVEMIPFSETRNYVQRVLESLQIYRYRLGITDVAFNIEKDLTR